jgi:tRNA-dihydrouridine synthase
VPTERFALDALTWLAPLHGVGGPATRAVLVDHGGVGVVCIPFLRITGQPPGAAWLRRQVVRLPGPRLSVQLMGRDAENLSLAAAVLSDCGVDVVDLNLGCPSRVCRKGVGGALLTEPTLVSQIVSRMRNRTDCLLSVKLRAGSVSCDQALEVASRAAAAGADLVVLHPRSRVQLFSGVADWSIVAELKRALPIPVIGNGDCWYAADALRLMDWTGCDGVMLGRPALRNPWIFRQIADLRESRSPIAPSGPDVMGHLDRLATALTAESAARRRGAVGSFKEHVRYLLRAVPDLDRATLTRTVLQHDTIPGIFAALHPVLAWRSSPDLDLDAHGTHRLERSPVSADAAASRATPPRRPSVSG